MLQLQPVVLQQLSETNSGTSRHRCSRYSQLSCKQLAQMLQRHPLLLQELGKPSSRMHSRVEGRCLYVVCGDVGREVIRLTHFQGDSTQGQGGGQGGLFASNIPCRC
jgi:hypothetical protein